ncbi:hypothetical protein ANN_13245 [Periplaneta americana]|uniref:Transposable element Tc1 transposase n=1 Tax=Periplaneta americana TaxID=6978 RepID=A0ABQ8TJC9_PERAM|nr:hypothetical protein ANN_13245 [Periplaneta americana]
MLRKRGCHGRMTRIKPLVFEVNTKKRLEFANNNIDKDEAWWNDVIFVDESPFSVFSHAGRVMVWRKVKEDMKIDNLQPTVKHGGGKFMVWGCMSAAGVWELVFIDGCAVLVSGYRRVGAGALHSPERSITTRVHCNLTSRSARFSSTYMYLKNTPLPLSKVIIRNNRNFSQVQCVFLSFFCSQIVDEGFRQDEVVYFPSTSNFDAEYCILYVLK